MSEYEAVLKTKGHCVCVFFRQRAPALATGYALPPTSLEARPFPQDSLSA